MLLERIHFLAEGIFGQLSDDSGFSCHTLEHSYPVGESYEAKLPQGDYLCRRGFHQLADGKSFETFEIAEVPGHTGILFHWGNYNKDSAGCVLLGMKRLPTMIMFSRKAFNSFMYHLKGVDEFTLMVTTR